MRRRKNSWRVEAYRGKPAVSELVTENLRIVIHRLSWAATDRWFVSCHEIRMEDAPLESRDLLKARNEGLNLVRRKARNLYLEVRKAFLNQTDYKEMPEEASTP